MSDAEKSYQATPASTLEEQIMNPCIAKNEREWWAAAEIERLRKKLTLWGNAIKHAQDNEREIERLRTALTRIADTPFSDVGSVQSFAAAAIRRRRDA